MKKNIDTDHTKNRVDSERHPGFEVAEIIHPKHLPEVAFQSYGELVASNASQARADFLSGKVRNPNFEQASFENLSHLDRGIINLDAARERVREIEQRPEYVDSINSSLEFRMAEMEYVKVLARLRYMSEEYAANPTEDMAAKIHELVDTARQSNIELYGRPKRKIADAALNEVWRKINNKQQHSSANKLYAELYNMLPRPESDEVLPQIRGNKALDWAVTLFNKQNADIREYIDNYWQRAVTEHGEDYVCQPEDIVDVFKGVIAMRGGEGVIDARIAPGRTDLSWESSELAVCVGEGRDPIDSADELYRKVSHEYGKHGQSCISGLKSDLPILGTGLYTRTPRPDYLTFEEGLPKVIEMMIGDEEPSWEIRGLAYTIGIFLSETEKYDFRDNFETSWRYILLNNLDDDEAITERAVEEAKKLAYIVCVRIYRGTQPDISRLHGLEDIEPLTFNKDLAYLEGQVLAIAHLEELYENQDVAGFERLFKAKYDPTNPVQDELVCRVLG